MIVNTVVLVRGGFGMNEQDVALALAAYGGGSMLAALTLPKMLDHLPDRSVMLAGAGLLAAGLLVGSAVSGFRWLLLLWFLMGCATSLIHTPTGRLLRRSSAEQDRAAYFAAHFSLSHACWLMTYPLVGWLGASVGMTATFFVMAGMVALGFLLAFRLWPAKQQTELTHTHKDLPPSHPHLSEAKFVGDGYQHRHEYVIDHTHRIWPKQYR